MVRMLTPHVSGGHVLGSGAVCCDILLDKKWTPTQSFDAVFLAVIILHVDDSPMRAISTDMYPSEKRAKEDYTGFLV
jgi:ubiquitin-protein ligase